MIRLISLNPYTFHITLYDLAFLATIFVGLTFAWLLWFTKRSNLQANRLLAIAMVATVLWIAKVLGTDIGLEKDFPGWRFLPLQFSLALGPLIYFYVVKITRPEYQFKRKDLLHFGPLLLQLGTCYAMPGQPLGFILQVLVFASVAVYLYRCRSLIEDFYQLQKFNGGDRYRYELRWLHRL